MAIKAVLFDNDGVITQVETFPERLEHDYGISRQKTASFFEGPFQKALIGQADITDELGKYIVDWGWQDSIDNLLTYWFNTESWVNDKILNTVRTLRQNNIKCLLATNQERYRTDFLLLNMDFGVLFDNVYSSAFIGYKKPQREFFEFIFINTKLRPEEFLYFDNDMSNVNAAKALGINAYLYTDFKQYLSVLRKSFPNLRLG